MGHARAGGYRRRRSVRHRRNAIPAAGVCDADEKREQPQPKRGRGEALSMAVQQVRHGFGQARRFGTNTAVIRLTLRTAHIPDA